MTPSFPRSNERHILWVSIDEHTRLIPVDKSSTTHITYQPSPSTARPLYFHPSSIKRIRAHLRSETKGYLNTFTYTGKIYSALHQTIVTTEHLHQTYPFQITYLSSVSAALSHISTKTTAEKKNLLIWLDALQDIHPYTWARAYDSLTHECGAIYPPREEIVWADAKIYDMLAFDRIAEETGTWRPKTCYPGTTAECTLSSANTSVMKRSNSCGGDHVQILRADARGGPKCTEGKYPVDHEDELDETGFYRWFHQDYVTFLVDFGEFRVFVATEGSSGVAATRTPYIVNAIHTLWKDDNADSSTSSTSTTNMIARNATKLPKGYSAARVTPQTTWPQYPQISYSTLTAYALDVYKRLQATGDIGFSSLNVGARLDIGVAPDGKGFFVNEVTRWYGAHQFAVETQEEPYDSVARAFAKAFAETLGAKMRNIEEVNTRVIAKVPSRRRTIAAEETVVKRPRRKGHHNYDLRILG
ncbi:hypothetical protein PtrSN002B_004050 [Pyrenophora tritici-repentis]|uniref:AMPKBI domain containing protein n=2 Tax=Pyrenophora tritici-repentis TaxID=45151 RepID=A0A2W1E0K2_9PLEO|nr:uncharacterized protein PTRG_11611 [Pyrenophora tritici-repentis Pt-1C-BFP]KAA8627121.1 hypothetical protein PtrV1_02801 [Pyrenophora tritici-repentis]EDU44661.1 conserved hypothetical protein [Pyrenophora tritici-repentis Pt-1C-BFP]KAF7455553.1 hypothetical protein A1F99_028110 [Pyrenophora tritici-repentis]KAF7578758.1 AMPKBI domain containing protein [Pyrenophora tritici-repentis]KAG9389307.1 hypothetical protein A1F94_002200 [Pyrenophora tritici-repentis]